LLLSGYSTDPTKAKTYWADNPVAALLARLACASCDALLTGSVHNLSTARYTWSQHSFNARVSDVLTGDTNGKVKVTAARVATFANRLLVPLREQLSLKVERCVGPGRADLVVNIELLLGSQVGKAFGHWAKCRRPASWASRHRVKASHGDEGEEGSGELHSENR
jgi:hypothetical protein